VARRETQKAELLELICRKKAQKAQKIEGQQDYEQRPIGANQVKDYGGIFARKMLLFCDFCAFLRLSQLRSSG